MDTSENLKNTIDRDIVEAEMRKRIADLPQYDWVLDHHIDSWIDRVLINEPERALWHVDRMGGFGGSDMGTLVKHLDGRPGDFTTAPQIISGKLCIAAPSKGDKHTRRGQRMEPVVQEFFENQMRDAGQTVTRLDEVREAAIEGAENDVYPWMRSSLDGYYDIDGKKVIVDFKAPSADVMAKYRSEAGKLYLAAEGSIEENFIPTLSERRDLGQPKLDFDDYIYQLHHYYEDARIKGVRADEMWLAVFDYSAAEVAIFKIAIDHEVIAKLTEAGTHFWESCVLSGKIPDPVKSEILQAEDIDEKLLNDADRFVALDLGSKALKRDAEALQQAMVDTFRDMEKEIPEEGVLLGATEIKLDRKIDQDLAYDRLCELGFTELQIDDLRKPSDFDTKKLKSGMTDLKLNFASFLQAVKSGDVKLVSENVRSMRNSLGNMTEKKKGDFDEEKLKKALLSCGDDPKIIETEEIKVGVTRKKSPEKDLIKNRVEKEIDEVQVFLAEPQLNEITQSL